jgi:hypothetical protein
MVAERVDCNYVEIYDKSASGVEERGFQANSNGGYFGGIEDLGGDGHLELVVGKYFGAKYTEDGSNRLARPIGDLRVERLQLR